MFLVKSDYQKEEKHMPNKDIRRYYKGRDVFNLPLYDCETYEKLKQSGEEPRKLIYFRNEKNDIFGALARYKDGDKVVIDLLDDSALMPLAWVIKFADWCAIRFKCTKCGLEKHPDEFNLRQNKSGLLKHTRICIYCNNEKRGRERDMNSFKYMRMEK